MNRPTAKTLWRLAITLTTMAVLDVVLTSIGVFFFYGEEGNPLIVALAQYLPNGEESWRIVIAVWLSKISVIAGILLAAHCAVKSVPARDDWLMFYGLSISIGVYIIVCGSWVWYFVLVTKQYFS